MRSEKVATPDSPPLEVGRWADHGRHGRDYLQEPGWPRCSVGKCPRPRWAKDLCTVHYRMVREYGVPTTGWHDPDNIRERRIRFLWQNIDMRGPGDCWPWLRKPTPGGYGQLRWLAGPISAHRAVYELAHGAIPVFPGERTDIDHLCHDPQVCLLKSDCPHRLCCNPAHLEARPASANRKRGDTSRPMNGQGSSKCKPGCACGRHRSRRAGSSPPAVAQQ